MKNKNAEKIHNYPIAKDMLGEIKDEYKMENERENKINNKASSFLAMGVAIITLYIPMIPFERFIKFWNYSNNTDKIIFVVFIVLFIIGMFAMLFSFVLLLKAYGVKGYRRLDVDDLLNLSYGKDWDSKEKKSQVYQGLVEHYHKILRGTLDEDGNMKINSDSADSVKNAIKWIIVGFLLISISTIFLRILVV